MIKIFIAELKIPCEETRETVYKHTVVDEANLPKHVIEINNIPSYIWIHAAYR